MKAIYFTITILLTICGCQSQNSNHFETPEKSNKDLKAFDSEYQNRLNLLISSKQSQETNTLKLMSATLQECIPKHKHSNLDGSKCASDSLMTVYDYMDKNFQLRDVEPDYYENFKTATKDWVLLMTKLKTDPTYIGIALLTVKSKLSLSLALSTTPQSN
ncbi:hypothetical protein O165_003835 [Pseudomonas soli]|nr:hypothetical protein O165_003835 [Pseudomonas soli]